MSTDRHAVELVLREQQREADAMVSRGAVAIALVPVSIVAAVFLAMAFDGFLPLVIAALYSTLGGTLGVIWLGAGLLRSSRAKRELRELDDARLPKARLLR